MKKKLMIVFSISLLFVLSCNKSPEVCEEERLTPAFLLDFPDTVAVGQVFNLSVNYVIENSCGEFGKFEAQRMGNILEVRLKANYTGCNCAEEFEEREATYPIIFEEPATYELKFWISEDDFDSYIVVAN